MTQDNQTPALKDCLKRLEALEIVAAKYIAYYLMQPQNANQKSDIRQIMEEGINEYNSI